MTWPYLVFSVALAFASEITSIPKVGPHYRVLTVDKSENPQNTLEIYTRLNPDCSLKETKGDSVIGYYWLMDHERYKRVNSLILSGIRERLELTGPPTSHSFNIAVNDLKELDNDIANHPVQVTARREGGRCALEVRLTLGPSDGNKSIRLTGIHTESKKTFLPPFRKVTSMTLKGIDMEDGLPVTRTYSAKR